MVRGTNYMKMAAVLGLLVVALCAFAPMGFAAEPAEGAAAAGGGLGIGDGLRAAGIAIGAALAIFGAAAGTGRAQAAIGAAGVGALAEKPELFGRVFILVALPETMIVFGFVMATMILLFL